MPTLPPPPAGNPAEAAPLVTRLGSVVGFGAAGALACSFPAMMRISSLLESEGRAKVWLALAAAALGPMVLAVVVLRGAREGLRAFGGPGATLRAFGVALWGASLLVGLSIFGALLRATTHHHALAGVTFGFGAVALAAASALFCVRIVAILRAASPSVRYLLGGALGAAAFLGLAWVMAGFLRAVMADGPPSPAPGSVVDVLAFTLAALFGARRSPFVRRSVALFGPPIAAVVLAVGISSLRDRSVLDVIAERAPAFAPAANLAAFR